VVIYFQIMSGYRNYVPWNKSSNSSSSYSAPTTNKKEATQAKYDSSFGKKKTAEDDKSATSRIASKYGAYGSGYQRDTSASGTVYQDNSMSPNRGEITTRFFL
jgi:hypothetical protein